MLSSKLPSLNTKNAVGITAGRDVNVTGEVIGRDKNVYYNFGPSEKEELSQFLALAAQSYGSYIRSVLLNAPTLTTPYLFLLPFDIRHHTVFFGRDNLVGELRDIVLNNRLTVLHAHSGAGKSSLLNAGLGPWLIMEPRILPIFARTYTDPVSAIIRELVCSVPTPIWPKLLSKVPLHEALVMLAQRPNHPSGEKIVIMLDQFEELFTKTSYPVQVAVLDAIASCVDDKALPAHFVLAIRREYLGDLDDFRWRLPTILDIRYPLRPMTRSEIETAIVEPIKKVDSGVSYDKRLLETLVTTLARAGMDLTTLQIICTRLYEATKSSKKPIVTPELYKELGEVEGILAGYIDFALAPFSPKEKELARQVLLTLVDSTGQRQMASAQEIRQRMNNGEKTINSKRLDRLLSDLVEDRLIHVSHIEQDDKHYELVHDYLAAEVIGWMEPQDLAHRQVRELVERGLAGYRLGALLDITALQLIRQYQHEINWNEQEITLIGHSALIKEFEMDFWIDQLVQAKQIEVLLEGFKAQNSDISNRSAEALVLLKDPRTIEPLTDILLKEKNNRLCNATAKLLGELGDVRATKALIQVLDNPSVRVTAASSIKRIANRDDLKKAVETLFKNKAIDLELFLHFFRNDNEGVHSVTSLERKKLQTSPISPNVERLINELYDPDRSVREEAVKKLGEIGDPSAVEHLSSLYVSDGEFVPRQEIIVALGQIGIPAIPSLASILENQSSFRLLCEAAEALGKIQDPGSVKPLIKIIKEFTKSDFTDLGEGYLDGRYGYKEMGFVEVIATDSLKSLLEHITDNIETDDLLEINGFIDHLTISYNVNYCSDIVEHDNTIVDFKLVKQIARQELIRRGFKA